MIKWNGFDGNNQYSWDSRDNLAQAKDLVKAFCLRYPDKPCLAPPIPRMINAPQSVPTSTLTSPKRVTRLGKLAKLASAIPAAF